MVDFEVIIKKHNGKDRRYRYYGSIFILPDHIQTKGLNEFNENEGTVSATFSFPQDFISQGRTFSACIYRVYENDDIDSAVCKIGTNSGEAKPEVVEFI